ncbi:hypothetical protein ACTU6U_11210 [Microbacterium sp. A196]|uniref:hypothetical protein n=1 Tax=Microbacterium sp. A196 TaxID=3457320 RepID=UPI003FD67904
MNAEDFWPAHLAVLSRVRRERPRTFEAVKAILDTFSPPSRGEAFFPDGGFDNLADALLAAGWGVEFDEATHAFRAWHPGDHDGLIYDHGDIRRCSTSEATHD